MENAKASTHHVSNHAVGMPHTISAEQSPSESLRLSREMRLNRGIKVLEAQPDHYPTLLEMGQLMFQMRRWDAGVLQYRHALEAATNNAAVKTAVLSAAEHCLANEMPDSARELYLAYLSKHPADESAIEKWSQTADSPTAKSLVELHYAKPADYRVSAIISTYCSEAFMRECLDNMLAQSIGSGLEIVVVDAASPENEREIVHDYLSRHYNITYIRTRSRIGIYAAWNLAIAHATGHYCLSMSTNDQLAANGCEILARTLDENPRAVLAYGNTYLTRNAHETFEQNRHYATYRWGAYDYAAHLEDGCCIGPHPMWRRTVHATVGYFDERYRAVGDQEFWMRLGASYPLLYIDEFTGLQWITPDAISGKGDLPALEVAAIKSKYQHMANTSNDDGPLMTSDLSGEAASAKYTHVTNAPRTDGQWITNDIPSEAGSCAADILKAIGFLLMDGQIDAANWLLNRLLADYCRDAPEQHFRACLTFER